MNHALFARRMTVKKNFERRTTFYVAHLPKKMDLIIPQR